MEDGKIKRTIDSDDLPPPSRPPIRTTTPSIIIDGTQWDQEDSITSTVTSRTGFVPPEDTRAPSQPIEQVEEEDHRLTRSITGSDRLYPRIHSDSIPNQFQPGGGEEIGVTASQHPPHSPTRKHQHTPEMRSSRSTSSMATTENHSPKKTTDRMLAVMPGAVSVAPDGMSSTLRRDLASGADDDEDEDYDDIESHNVHGSIVTLNELPLLPLAAEVSPDDQEEDMTARLAERLERQISETIEERVKVQVQTQFSQQLQQQKQQQRQQRQERRRQRDDERQREEQRQQKPHDTPVVRAEIVSNNTTKSLKKSSWWVEDNFVVCCLRRRTWGVIFFLILLLAVGGIVGWIIFFRPDSSTQSVLEDDESSPSPPSSPAVPMYPGNNETETSSSSSSSPSDVVLALWDEISPIIAPSSRDDGQPFQNPSSPQFLAWKWIEMNAIPLLDVNTPTEQMIEYYVLAVLYYATNGPLWTNQNLGYLSSSNPFCEWNNGRDPRMEYYSSLGVFCVDDDNNNNENDRGDDDGNEYWVSHLLFHRNGLQGTLPWELSLLSGLRVIGMDENELQGSIPLELSTLSELHNFWAVSNGMTGSLPITLGGNLQSLDLSRNQFSGTIPPGWGTTMPRLFSIGLGHNELTGSIPEEWTNMEFLEQLDLASNRLTGFIPDGSAGVNTEEDDGVVGGGMGWFSLKSLFLEDNRLSGPIPPFLSELTRLEYLILYNNTLTGSIPSTLGKLTTLVQLSLARNDFLGSLDETLCQSLSSTSVAIETDCLNSTASRSGGTIEVQCSCCSTCCTDDQGGFCEVYDN